MKYLQSQVIWSHFFKTRITFYYDKNRLIYNLLFPVILITEYNLTILLEKLLEF